MSERPSHSDRREFYRISDLADVRWVRTLPPQTNMAATLLFPDSIALRLLREVRGMEADAQRALRRLPDQDRGLTAYLRSCDRRLELLASAVAALYERDRPLQPQPVSLSEGGMAVTLPGDWSPGDTLALQITFPDDYLCLCTHATIVGLPELPDTGHSVRFDRMDDQERALLARHILQRQSQERRQAQLSGD